MHVNNAVCLQKKHNLHFKNITRNSLLAINHQKVFVVLGSIILSIAFVFCSISFAHAQESELISFEVPESATATFNDDGIFILIQITTRLFLVINSNCTYLHTT